MFVSPSRGEERRASQRNDLRPIAAVLWRARCSVLGPGTAKNAAGDAGEEIKRAYMRAFRGVDPSDYTAYRFRSRTVKLFDARTLAPATLVTARVTRDGLVWVKTEVWT
jgi:hypothetical protein